MATDHQESLPNLLAKARERAAEHAEYALQLEEIRVKREALILAALAAGATHAELAAVTGLTRGRIGQIAQRGETPRTDDT